MSRKTINRLVGSEHLTVGSTVVQLSKYKAFEQYGELIAYVLVEDNTIRFKIQEDPTASEGFPLGFGFILTLHHDTIPNFKMIAKSGTAKVNVLYLEV